MLQAYRWRVLVAAVLLWIPTAQAEVPDGEKGRTIKAGEEGSTLESMTIEGEDRIRIEFERPELSVDIDPATVPGLDWDVVWGLLDDDALALYDPLVDRSRYIRSAYRPRPWLHEFREGDVVRFRPALERVERWTLTVGDSRGETVVSLGGRGNPPKEIGWDGRRTDGSYALPGLRYSFVLEAADKAGNKRSFVGDGFELPPYRVTERGGLKLLFSAPEPGGEGVPPTLLDASSRINQLDPRLPVTVVVTAPEYNTAGRVADRLADQLRGLVIGDRARVGVRTEVKTGAPEGGTVTIEVGTKASGSRRDKG